jgi:large subunit ribosomal protein L15
MQKFDLKAPSGANKKKRILGRGCGSGRGSTAGRGTKGQNCRAGGGVRPGFEGGQMPLYRRLARRGFSNYPFKKQYTIVNLSDLKGFKQGETVSLDSLIKMGIIKKKNRPVKLLAGGELSQKLIINIEKISVKAKEKILKAGGQIKGLNPVAEKKGTK